MRWLVLVSTLLMAACADEIKREALLERINEGSAPPIVDVRSRAEYDASHVPGAIHIPFYAILGGSETLPTPAEQGQPIVIYCQHGPRAGIARAQLWFVRDEPVRFLEGHMSAWQRDGLPIEPAEVRESPDANRLESADE